MKRGIILFVLFVTLSSCSQPASEVKNPFKYIMDDETGLCFSTAHIDNIIGNVVTNGSNSDDISYGNTMTCVPCDSLKHVNIIHFNVKK